MRNFFLLSSILGLISDTSFPSVMTSNYWGMVCLFQKLDEPKILKILNSIKKERNS